MIRVVKPATPPAVLLTRGAIARQSHCDDYDAAPDDYRTGTRTFKFNRSIYAAEEVKAALLDAQRNKCAFCESHVRHVAHGDVEHFRPKAGYQQRQTGTPRRPGYYWLAYSWENLFFCCQLCNNLKRNHFPLRDDRRRARSPADDLGAEEPLLVDPARPDPATFIRFRRERAVAVRGCREGRTTIRVLGLNRPALIEARARWLQTLKRLKKVRELLRQQIAVTPRPALVAQLAELDVTLRASCEDGGEYAAMARAFLG